MTKSGRVPSATAAPRVTTWMRLAAWPICIAMRRVAIVMGGKRREGGREDGRCSYRVKVCSRFLFFSSCYDAAGSAQCFCTSGFTGAACEQCDVNYSGYPNCTGIFNSPLKLLPCSFLPFIHLFYGCIYLFLITANPDSDEDSEGEACTAPLLPNSLNTAAYLGYTGHLRI